MILASRPFIGGVVHFVKYNELMPGPNHLAAVIVDVHDNGNVDLVIFPNTLSLAGTTDVVFDTDEKKPNTWHWIELSDQLQDDPAKT